ncbi:MAG: hypothetical protein SFY81_06450 [Verrucomicrobiota bacterium]|nr:hypothetical protein [Verrucomicrobiota bacterium]
MSSDGEDFKDLQRLLALKRHEQPPPGFHERLPHRVITQIDLRYKPEPRNLWELLVARFDAKPLLACAYGFTISSLLLAGFRLAQYLENDGEGLNRASASGWLAATPDPTTLQPGPFLKAHFANPAGLVNFSASDSLDVDTQPLPLPLMPQRFSIQNASFTVME